MLALSSTGLARHDIASTPARQNSSKKIVHTGVLNAHRCGEAIESCRHMPKFGPSRR
jgi:hypothetical protein